MRVFLIISLALFSIACSEEEVIDTPENILSPEQFEEVLTDVQIIEAHLNEVRINQVFVKDSAQFFYNEIFLKHNITSLQFEEAITYYTGFPEQLKLIYENVLEKLSVMEADLGEVETNKEIIAPLGKKIMVKILADNKIGELFLNDSIRDQTIIRDSVFRFFLSDMTILGRYNTNMESFQYSYNSLTKAGFNFLQLKESVVKQMNLDKEEK